MKNEDEENLTSTSTEAAIEPTLPPAPEIGLPEVQASSIKDVQKFAETIQRSSANPFAISQSAYDELKAAGLVDETPTSKRLLTGKTLNVG